MLLQLEGTDFFMGLTNHSVIFLVTLDFSFRSTYSLDTSCFSKCSVNRVKVIFTDASLFFFFSLGTLLVGEVSCIDSKEGSPGYLLLL